MRCTCGNKVLQKSGSAVRLRTHGPVEFHDNGTCKTKCYWCKSDLVIPLQVVLPDSIPTESFVLLKGAKE